MIDNKFVEFGNCKIVNKSTDNGFYYSIYFNNKCLYNLYYEKLNPPLPEDCNYCGRYIIKDVVSKKSSIVEYVTDDKEKVHFYVNDKRLDSVSISVFISKRFEMVIDSRSISWFDSGDSEECNDEYNPDIINMYIKECHFIVF